MVELVRLYSNLALSVLALVELRSQAGARIRAADPVRQVHHRLGSAEVVDLIEAYSEGRSIEQLAQRFGIHRVTVTALLRRHGVELSRSGLAPEEIPEAISFYGRGWSCARLGEGTALMQ